MKNGNYNRKLYTNLYCGHFKDVSHCLRHNCKLIDSCPHCNYSLKAIANFSRLGFCSRCKNWLGSNITHDLSFEIDDEKHSTIENIGELIAITPSLKSSLSLPSVIDKLKFVHIHFKSVFTRSLDIYEPFSYHDLSFGEYVKKLEIITEHKSEQPLNLIKLVLPICYKSKITLSQFLLYDVYALSKTLQENLNIERANNSRYWHWRL